MGRGMRDWERGNERENGQGMRYQERGRMDRVREREVEWALGRG